MLKKISLLLLVICFCSAISAQLIRTIPAFPAAGKPVTIEMNTSFGNKALLDYSNTNDVYVHIGVITNLSTSSSDWRAVKFDWGVNNSEIRTTYAGNGIYTYTIQDVNTFFTLAPGEVIQKIAILFRTGNGNIVQRNVNGSDIFIPIYDDADLNIKFTDPGYEPFYEPTLIQQAYEVGEAYSFEVITSKAATFSALLNGAAITPAELTDTTARYDVELTDEGNYSLQVNSTSGIENASVTHTFTTTAAATIAPLPEGVRQGVNFVGDSVTLVLYAPGKNKVNLAGEFNSWNVHDLPLKKTPDGDYFWITIGGLTNGNEYAYQYVIDDNLVIADPYATLILDPWNDQYISSTTYPGLKPYPAGRSGIVSVLQPGAAAYQWDVQNFQRHDKRSLTIYELLVRDWHAQHSWDILTDSIAYFKRLGINTIELLPVNEFEGNISWGYNPDFFFTPDKYYGTANSLKRFIDTCHKNGIAVVIDMVLNHHFGLSPLVQMYWDGGQNRPAADNPWFNPVARHPFNVGFDMNHDQEATRYFFKRVVEFWLKEFKVDGFRFDLSKGFTQKNTCLTQNCDTGEEVALWSAYDAERIALWKQYYDTIQKIEPGAYVILEHLAENSEEIELANYGMLLWGNMHYNFKEAVMGWVSNSNFEWALHTARNFNEPHLVSYMESHDENRLMYEAVNFGNSSGSYNIRDSATAMRRVALTAAFYTMMPGPKMIWQFGEQGYAYHINYCENGTIDNDCRTSPKPLPWQQFAQNANRRQLFSQHAHFFALRNHPSFKPLFVSGNITHSLGGGFKWMQVSNDSMSIVVIGNFDVITQTGSVTFPRQGVWYNYMNNQTHQATGASQSFTLAPGEFRIYINKNLNETTPTPVEEWINPEQKIALKVFPNPMTYSSILQYELPFHSNVQIELINMNGQRVLELYKGYRTTGAYTIHLNNINGFAALQKGVYFVRMQLGNKTYTEKVVK